MMNNEQTNQNTQEGKREWVFIPLSKKHLIKRTDTYVLFDVDGQASGIISTRFLRKKETEDMLYFSVPEDYEINCKVRELINHKWKTTLDYKVKAKELADIVIDYNRK